MIQKEISAVRASADEEYDLKLQEVQKEINKAIEEANRQRETIQRQISGLHSQQSSLGFFKGKEKRALQVHIDEMQSYLNKVPSQQIIREGYQSRIAQINIEKKEFIDRRSLEIRSCYPLPILAAPSFSIETATASSFMLMILITPSQLKCTCLFRKTLSQKPR